MIENEFGEIGIDDALVKQKFDTEEEIFEVSVLLGCRAPLLPSACCC